jgi:exosortase/archaeosortase family protein
VFELVNGQYEIAEACAGLRFLVATVALGVLFVHLVYRKKAKIILFLAACCVVPVIGNGIRALLTVMVANFTNNQVAVGFDHIVYGWMFAVAIIFVLLFIGSAFRDPDADIVVEEAPAVARKPRYWGLLATLAGALMTVSVAPALANFLGHSPPPINRVALNGLTVIPGWHQQDLPGDWQIEFNPGDAQLASSLAPNERAV